MTQSTSAQNLGITDFSPQERIEWRNAGDTDLVIRAVYRQVLGNDYLMKSERLAYAESQLRNGNVTVREFVRAVAKSELYKQKFFYPNANNRFIELNYKHLLGRAPYDQSEISFHLDLYHNQGYNAEIDSYIDSPEYQASFWENIVPTYRGFWTQPGQKIVGFSRMFRLYRGYANSDRSQLEQSSPRLNWELAQNKASTVVGPAGVNDAWAYRAPQNALTQSRQGPPLGQDGRIYRVEVAALSGPGYPKVRRVTTSFLVPYDQLLQRMQQIHRQGGRIAGITPA
ncbi:phycocyanin-associated rod linker protein [Gloeomargarita lithophora Alchichica-D10]|uniref:Phycocyanin-associated rod linker protein n=1 Tax=Gloeomargarita lithophora Alchichica-D10 TaxID=1188229 RepID=A0A1J0AGP1_9CYAN|nr:phycobilisome linker polypeptide [Gloeomargarita lithophora]APB35102.1 phycocyanin-associated rod linker protein [Gloeomargarita lithophora Alchichica-D10]